MIKFYSFVMVLFIALTAHAQLVLNESFTGYATGNLNGQHGWVSEHSGNDAVVNNSSPLIYSTYQCGGEYITIDNVLGKDPYKPFAEKITTTSSKTVFLSFVVRVNDVVSNTGFLTMVLRDTFSLTPDVPCRFYVQQEYSPSNDIQFGIAVGSGAASFTTTDGSWAKGTTYLIVIRYDIVNGGADRACLWVNPSTFSEPVAGASCNSSFAISTSGEVNYGAEWNALQLFQSGSSTPKADLDAFRVAEGPTSAIAWNYLDAAFGNPPAQQNNDILLSPNPVSSLLTVQYPVVAAGAHIQIVGASGKLLKDQNLPYGSVSTIINMSSFAPGMYYVLYKNGGEMLVKSVLKH
jgi:hypothetical protein